MTREPSEKIEAEKENRIKTPFPNGESYVQTSVRMKDFLNDVMKKYDGFTIMVIGHRATQYGLEHLILGKPLDEVVTAPWSWQPGWEYELKSAL
jgi:broad specificity phosphatase PhoE